MKKYPYYLVLTLKNASFYAVLFSVQAQIAQVDNMPLEICTKYTNIPTHT